MSLQDRLVRSLQWSSAVEVGIRELRADFSRWLKRVRAGEEIVVTDRGKAVARLLPMNGERPIDRLIAAGVVRPATGEESSRLPAPIEGVGPISDLVLEGRR
jgi:prevent-host-death family protein